MTIITRGKINTYLDITGTSKNGFHNLDMVMSSISLCDEITIEIGTGETSVLMLDERGNELNIERSKNTVWKAVDLFFDAFREKIYENYNDCGKVEKVINKCGLSFLGIPKNFNVAITVKKGIPYSAGLGGSSADPAAVLTALGELFGISYSEYSALAPEIGSDVLFMLRGGDAEVSGTGEIVRPLPFQKRYGVIVKPEGGVNTALCYAEYDKHLFELYTSDNRALCGHILNAEVAENLGLTDLIYNALSIPAMKLNREVRDIYNFLQNEKNAVAVMMTGSGSAVFAITENEEKARELAGRIPKKYYSSIFETMEKGNEIAR